MLFISRFFGIAILMYYREHEPPHFHATHGEYEIVVTVHDGRVTGRFPPRALALVLEWAAMNREALLRNWDRARAEHPLEPIRPLE